MCFAHCALCMNKLSRQFGSFFSPLSFGFIKTEISIRHKVHRKWWLLHWILFTVHGIWTLIYDKSYKEISYVQPVLVPNPIPVECHGLCWFVIQMNVETNVPTEKRERIIGTSLFIIGGVVAVEHIFAGMARSHGKMTSTMTMTNLTYHSIIKIHQMQRCINSFNWH